MSFFFLLWLGLLITVLQNNLNLTIFTQNLGIIWDRGNKYQMAPFVPNEIRHERCDAGSIPYDSYAGFVIWNSKIKKFPKLIRNRLPAIEKKPVVHLGSGWLRDTLR